MALSLETARDHLVSFAESAPNGKAGQKKPEQFKGTDLLDHLSEQMDKMFGRNLEREMPDIFKEIKSLYAARHHVAHGKPPLKKDGNSMRPINETDIKAWLDNTHTALEWMEKIS